MERIPQLRYGPVSRVTAEAEHLLQEQIGVAPDATLAELQQLLWDKLQIEISRSQMSRLLQRMQLRRKKNASRR
jgi:transposase